MGEKDIHSKSLGVYYGRCLTRHHRGEYLSGEVILRLVLHHRAWIMALDFLVFLLTPYLNLIRDQPVKVDRLHLWFGQPRQTCHISWLSAIHLLCLNLKRKKRKKKETKWKKSHQYFLPTGFIGWYSYPLIRVRAISKIQAQSSQ